MFYFWNRTAFQFSHKQERLQVLWFVKFWSCKHKLSKQLGIGDINNIYVRARLKPGWVRWVFHFTFEWLWIFTRPNLSFSRPKFFHWNLGCFAQGRFQHEILRSLPLSRFTVERDRTFPTALFEKKSASNWRVAACSNFWRDRQLTWLIAWTDFCFWIQWREGTIFLWCFSATKVSEEEMFGERITCDVFTHVIYIYISIYIYYMKRLLQISDKVSGSRWKLPTQPVSSRNK